ncbi:hypothetical protein Q5752_000729 [Cryptotrichosporon argae]
MGTFPQAGPSRAAAQPVLQLPQHRPAYGPTQIVTGNRTPTTASPVIETAQGAGQPGMNGALPATPGVFMPVADPFAEVEHIWLQKQADVGKHFQDGWTAQIQASELMINHARAQYSKLGTEYRALVARFIKANDERNEERKNDAAQVMNAERVAREAARQRDAIQQTLGSLQSSIQTTVQARQTADRALLEANTRNEEMQRTIQTQSETIEQQKTAVDAVKVDLVRLIALEAIVKDQSAAMAKYKAMLDRINGTAIEVPTGCSAAAIADAMCGHIVGQAEQRKKAVEEEKAAAVAEEKSRADEAEQAQRNSEAAVLDLLGQNQQREADARELQLQLSNAAAKQTEAEQLVKAKDDEIARLKTLLEQQPVATPDPASASRRTPSASPPISRSQFVRDSDNEDGPAGSTEPALNPPSAKSSTSSAPIVFVDSDDEDDASAHIHVESLLQTPNAVTPVPAPATQGPTASTRVPTPPPTADSSPTTAAPLPPATQPASTTYHSSASQPASTSEPAPASFSGSRQGFLTPSPGLRQAGTTTLAKSAAKRVASPSFALPAPPAQRARLSTARSATPSTPRESLPNGSSALSQLEASPSQQPTLPVPDDQRLWISAHLDVCFIRRSPQGFHCRPCLVAKRRIAKQRGESLAALEDVFKQPMIPNAHTPADAVDHIWAEHRETSVKLRADRKSNGKEWKTQDSQSQSQTPGTRPGA